MGTTLPKIGKIVIEEVCEKLMKNDKIVTINGRKYDNDTGLPVDKLESRPKTTTNKRTSGINTVHSLAHKTQALYSRTAQKTVGDIKSPIRKIGRNMDIARSKSISHFAPHTIASSTKPTSINKNVGVKHIKHPLATKVEKKRLIAKNIPTEPTTDKSAKDIKQEAIAEALSRPSKKPTQKRNLFKRNLKFFNIFSISIIVLLIAGYLIYLNMPNISVRIASVQAGINATYPEYRPDGYSISGPVSYSDGEVTINFHANTGNSQFVIKQSKSSWDSSAVKLQVNKDSNNETSESKEGGLTIYTYNNNTNAAWVNGGILYTITGDAKLSGEQIRHIATSL